MQPELRSRIKDRNDIAKQIQRRAAHIDPSFGLMPLREFLKVLSNPIGSAYLRVLAEAKCA